MGIAVCSAEIDVLDAPNIDEKTSSVSAAPIFTECLPSEKHCLAGESVVCHCVMTGWPQIEWLRGDETFVPQPDRFQLLYDGEKATLR